MIRTSHLRYRTSSNIVPFRTLEIFDRSNHRISNHRTSSNIEHFRILEIFDRSNHRISNHRTSSNIEPHRILQIYDRSNHRISNFIEYRTFLNQQLFDRSNHRISNFELEYSSNGSVRVTLITTHAIASYEDAYITRPETTETSL